jgi:putative ABC transport system ATP-binding protein
MSTTHVPGNPPPQQTFASQQHHAPVPGQPVPGQPVPGQPAPGSAPSGAAASTYGPAPVLSARRLVRVYGEKSGGSARTVALNGVDLDVHPAESLAIMGPSGSGKTTLLHVLGGILRPTQGTVQHGGTDLASLSDSRRTALRRSDFGFVFQDGQLLPELSAVENVILPRMLAGTSRRAATAEARGWLDRLGLAGMHDRRPGQLSGGQAQRVAIARALAGRPSVVFADEPTGALDQTTGQTVLKVLIDATRAAGASLVMVTHDPKVASVCERTIAMQDGRIAAEYQRDRDTPQRTANRQAGVNGGGVR